jgi:hypothetical protein
MDIPYAGLQLLCAPLWESLGQVAAPEGEALEEGPE